MTATTMPPTSPSRRVERTVIISIWAVPILVVGQFAMLALVPVVLALTVSLRHARLHGPRRWTIALATAYAAPLILWAIGPDRAPSLSRDMHPAFAALIVVTALAAAVAFHLGQRRPSRPEGSASERPHLRAAP